MTRFKGSGMGFFILSLELGTLRLVSGNFNATMVFQLQQSTKARHAVDYSGARLSAAFSSTTNKPTLDKKARLFEFNNFYWFSVFPCLAVSRLLLLRAIFKLFQLQMIHMNLTGRPVDTPASGTSLKVFI